MSLLPFPEGVYCKARGGRKLQYDPKWRLPERMISDNELVYVLRGQGSFTIGGRESRVGPGDCLILLPGIPHCASTVESDPFQLIFTHFDLMLGPNVKYSLRDPQWGEVVRLPRGLDIEALLLEVASEFDQKRPGYETIIGACVMQVLTKVYRHRHGLSLSPFKTKLKDKVASAVDYLYEHFGEECSTSDPAKRAHLHPVYFARVFKGATGMPPRLFLRRFRIQKAKDLILRSDLSFTQIARRVGFAGIHHFSRTFKRVEGLTPSQYLRSLKDL